MSKHAAHCAALLTLGLALTLTGCASTPPASVTPSPSATVQDSPTPTPTPTPSPTPTPLPNEPAVAVKTCDTALTEAAYEQLEADGLTPRDSTFFAEDEGDAIAALPDGIACTWTVPQSDITATYAQGSIDAEGWEAKRSDLLEAGWTEGDVPVEGVLIAPPDPGSGISAVVAWRDGVEYYASNDTVLSGGRAFAQ